MFRGKYTGLDFSLDFEALTSTHSTAVERGNIIFSRHVASWCSLPYIDHPNGCPNVGKCDRTYSPSILDSSDVIYLYWVEFDFGKYKSIRAKEHPNWGPRMLSNVLYWQGAVKKILGKFVEKDAKNKNVDTILGCGSGFRVNGVKYRSMEAAGIHALATLKRCNIRFERNPQSMVILVSIVGYKNKSNNLIEMIKGW